jgi:hypothetical protein
MRWVRSAFDPVAQQGKGRCRTRGNRSDLDGRSIEFVEE